MLSQTPPPQPIYPPSHLFFIHFSISVSGDMILIQLFIAVADKRHLSRRAEIEKDIVSLAQVSTVSA